MSIALVVLKLEDAQKDPLLELKAHEIARVGKWLNVLNTCV